MTPDLLLYAEHEPGYAQFCERYDLVASDPDTQNKYFWWYMDQLREEGRRITAVEMGMAQGIAQGLEKGMQQGMQQGQLVRLIGLIQRKRLKFKTREQIISDLDLEEDEIKILDDFESYKHLL